MNGDDRLKFGFVVGYETIGEGFQDRVVRACTECGQEQGAAQAGIAAFGDVGLAVHAGAGCLGRRIEPGVFRPRFGGCIIRQDDEFSEDSRFIKAMLDERYPTALKVRLILDNLNTHDLASLYETFPPAEARRLAERLEIHHTPKHGSWLNIAEIELSAHSGQCLSRRIPDLATMRREVSAWQQHRNTRGAPIHWRFTTADARIKLLRLYPKL